MKLKMIHDFNDKYQRGFVCEIDNITRTADCASGVKVRVVNMGKQPTWFDLGWFVPVVEGGLTKRAVGRVASVRPVKSKSAVATRR